MIRQPSPESRRNGMLIILGLLILAVTVRLILAAVDWSPQVELLISDTLTYELPMLSVVGMGFTLILGRRLIGEERRFWLLLVGANLCVLVFEVYWTIYSVTVDMRGPAPENPVRLLGLAAAVLFGMLVVSITRVGRESFAGRMRFYLDASASLLALYPLVYWFVAVPMIADLPRGGTIAAASAAVYPIVGLGILFVAVAAIAGWRAYRWRLWEQLTVASLVIYSLGLVSFIAWFPLSLQSESQGPSWYTLVLSLGQLLLLAAVVDRFTATPEEALAQPWPVPVLGPSWVWRAYPVAIALSLPVLGWLALRVAGRPHGIPVLNSTIALTLVLAARSWVAAVERAHHRVQAYTDPVTGARTMEGFEERLAALVSRSATRGRELALVLVDVVDLALINDRYGHAVGDRALSRLTEVIAKESSRGAEVVRLADDDIAVVLPDLTVEEARSFARRVYGRYRIAGVNEEGPAEITVGVAVFPVHALTATELLQAAMSAERAARAAVDEPIATYDADAMRDFDPEKHLEQARMRSLRATVRTLAEAVDARDPATRNHSANVADLATSLAQVLGLTDEQVQMIGLAALMHDVGKIGIPDEVLLKPAYLEPEERIQVEMHAQLGARILEPAGLAELLPLVRYHHERWDGEGYPEGLCGEQIPVGARILAVCDVFETITTGRPYHAAVTTKEALVEIERCAGTQFDPDIARAFCRMVSRLADSAITTRGQ